jgi:N-acyl-D-aspartate/D-glutamate deacylase
VSIDLVIRGGTVVDGTGAPPTRADIAVAGDRIVEIGSIDPSVGARVIDAEGRIVTPGFVDIHSHLDAQLGWDPLMSSSCWHGVTSVVLGNCGMTFAPMKPGEAEVLAAAMESVEDIPASCILEGLPWNWESYGEYLNAIEQLPRGLNAGGYIGDVALRLYVCGDRSCEEDFRASESEVAQMKGLVREAMLAGALGFSLSRSLFHRVPDGRNVPGTWADPAEFIEVTSVLGELAAGVVESAPRYNFPDRGGDRVEEELAWMADLSIRTGRPFAFNLQQISSLGDHYMRVLAIAREANLRGAQLRPQITPRGVGVLFSLAANSPLDSLPAWQPSGWRLERRLDALRDPSYRALLIAEGAGMVPESYDAMYVMRPGDVRYDFTPEDSLGALARRTGVGVVEAYIDLMLETNGAAIVNWPVMNQDETAIEHQLLSPVSILGLADAGAHATQIMDASQSTYLLAHWVRDRGVLPLESAVAKLTSDTAGFIGFKDRGILREGAFADINVVDLDGLGLGLPEIVHDFPGEVPRFVQRASGFDHTIINGVPFMEDGRHTGDLPGRVLRGAAYQGV